jgi:hypothetical protein
MTPTEILIVGLLVALAIGALQAIRAKSASRRAAGLLNVVWVTMFLSGFVLFAGCGGHEGDCGSWPTLWLVATAVFLFGAIAVSLRRPR